MGTKKLGANLMRVALICLGLLAQGLPSAAAAERAVCRFDAGVDAAGIVAACTPLIEARGTAVKALADALVARGRALSVLNDYRRAIADFDAALKLDPKKADAYAGRGETYLTRRQWTLAIADFDQAISLDPSRASPFVYRGTAFFMKRDFAEAEADWAEAIRLAPEWPEPYYNRALIHLRQNALDRAIADYDMAIRHNRRFALGYDARGHAYEKLGDPETAMRNYDMALFINPNLVSALAHRAGLNSLKADGDSLTRLAIRFLPYGAGRLVACLRGDAYGRAVDDLRKAIASPQKSARPGAQAGTDVALVIRLTGAIQRKARYGCPIDGFSRLVDAFWESPPDNFLSVGPAAE